MGYNKLQRKITAYIYGKRKINNVAVNTYKNYTEVKKVLNSIDGIKKKR
ncbi:MAG: hypothetical protein ACI4EF_01970 [Coprococcus sp.]